MPHSLQYWQQRLGELDQEPQRERAAAAERSRAARERGRAYARRDQPQARTAAPPQTQAQT